MQGINGWINAPDLTSKIVLEKFVFSIMNSKINWLVSSFWVLFVSCQMKDVSGEKPS